MNSDSDSDAPEELTAVQGIKQDEEIRRVQKENIARVAQEGKERRRQWAQRNSEAKVGNKAVTEVMETEEHEAPTMQGMLPSNIVDLLAASEKKVFSSDSEEEIINQKPITKRKKQKVSGPTTVFLNDIPPPQCLQNSMEFLKRRKMQVSRSQAVLKNAHQALRLLSSKGNLLSKG